MRTTRILTLLLASVATLTAVGAIAFFTFQVPTVAIQVGAGGPSASMPADVATTAAAPTTTAPVTTVPPTTVVGPTTTPPRPEPASGTLSPGAKGPEVLALQHRLRSLGYWLGTPDGTYGDVTVQAVIAFQKVEGLKRDGIVGPAVAPAIDRASRPHAASAGGDLIEIDKKRQVLFVVRDGTVDWILNVSTGTEKPYQLNGHTEQADTPPGQWHVTRVYDGVDVGALGALYRPRYFHPDGIAVHGYHDVPAYPASHGCVRVSNAAIDWIWAQGLMPIGSLVWVY